MDLLAAYTAESSDTFLSETLAPSAPREEKASPRRGLARPIRLPVVSDPRGDLTAIEGGIDVPFPIARLYYLYNVPSGAERGGHAHKELQQVLFALSGSFRVTVDDGTARTSHWLHDPRQGLFLSRLIWREIDAFTAGAVCMVLASARYDEGDYYRNYADFRSALRAS